MYLAETPDQQALRKELREYFAAMLTAEVRAELGESGEGKPLFRELVRQMGADGWLGLGWPKEFGGQ
ncbi:MAG: acyl-CoA dehydrogenase family protein, partial [Ilumatobacteraceae bacterium]